MLSVFSCACWPSVWCVYVCVFDADLYVNQHTYVVFLYILDIIPLSDISFANIFSHSVGGLFILLVVSFSVQKFFNLM